MTTQIDNKQIKHYLVEKRAELIWALHKQGFNLVDLGSIFRLHKQQVQQIVKQMPEGWESPWIKIKNIKHDN